MLGYGRVSLQADREHIGQSASVEYLKRARNARQDTCSDAIKLSNKESESALCFERQVPRGSGD